MGACLWRFQQHARVGLQWAPGRQGPLLLAPLRGWGDLGARAGLEGPLGVRVCVFTWEAGELALGFHPFFSARRRVEAGWPWKVSRTETEEEPKTPRCSHRADPTPGARPPLPLRGTEDNRVSMCGVVFRVGPPDFCVNSRSKMPFGGCARMHLYVHMYVCTCAVLEAVFLVTSWDDGQGGCWGLAGWGPGPYTVNTPQ